MRIFWLIFIPLCLSACVKPPEGPAERMGRSIDTLAQGVYDLNADNNAAINERRRVELDRREKSLRERERELDQREDDLRDREWAANRDGYRRDRELR